MNLGGVGGKFLRGFYSIILGGTRGNFSRDNFSVNVGRGRGVDFCGRFTAKF